MSILIQRRRWLQLGLVSAATLAVAGTGVAVWRADPALGPSGELSLPAQAIFLAVGQAVLEGSLPQGGPARDAALAGLMERVQGVTQALPRHARAELSQLLDVLSLAPGRRWLAGLSTDWPDAPVPQVQSALQGMRLSSLALRQQAYQALHDVVGGAFFSDPSEWALLGYPGPLDL